MDNYLEYNSSRNKLHIPEYGRNVQKMVEHAKTITDDDRRNETARAIIDVMGNMTPHLRDVVDFQHMLWDQLFIISDFELDVESPFPKPTREQLFQRPEPLGYPQNFPKYRFYGNNIKRMIDEALKLQEGEEKEALVLIIANHMKKSFLNWNRDSVKDDVIFKHLKELSDGAIDLNAEEESLKRANELVQINQKAVIKKANTNRNNNNRNRKRRN